jgi:hypothetical protein
MAYIRHHSATGAKSSRSHHATVELPRRRARRARFSLAAIVMSTIMPIARAGSSLDLIRVETEDKQALNGLLWKPPTLGDSLVILVPGATTGAALIPSHDYYPLATGQRSRSTRLPARRSTRRVFVRLSDSSGTIVAGVPNGRVLNILAAIRRTRRGMRSRHWRLCRRDWCGVHKHLRHSHPVSRCYRPDSCLGLPNRILNPTIGP